MNAIMVLWAALALGGQSVTALGVVPAEDRTAVVIEVDGDVAVADFPLSDPARIVVDLEGADETLSETRFTGIDRGGVRALRTSRFRPNVVRVVIDLAESVSYTVARRAGEVRVVFPNPAGEFAPWSTRPAAAPVAAEPEPQPAMPPAGPPTTQEEQRITVYFTNTPITDVLATFAEFSNRSIITGPGVDATITADIRDQPWDVALEALLSAHGLAASEQASGIIRVDAVDELRQLEYTEPLATRTIAIRYANVDSIFPAVEGLVCTLSRRERQPAQDTAMAQAREQLAFLAMQGRTAAASPESCRGGVTRNRSTNALIVTAPQSQMDGIVETVGQLDVRTPQVMIAAKILFVDRSALEGLGVSFDLKDSEGNQFNQLVPGFLDQNGDGFLSPDEQTEQDVISLGGNSIAALANAEARLPSRTLQIVTSLVLNRHTLISFIEALQSHRFTDVQARPTIRTLDHRAARVQVGEETPVRVVDAGAGGSGGGQAGSPAFPRATVQFKETGVILEVTPHVVGDQVLLELHAERSAVGLAPSDIGVVFNTQESDTQILVNDGETAVIGGLTLIEKEETRSGIPLLMDIPVLGALFRNTVQQETKQDLLIMVTPHIVREAEG